MISRLAGLVELMRPGNGLIGCVAFLLGMAIGEVSLPLQHLAWSFGVILLAYGFGNVDNDVVDFRVDRRVHPGRPLPQGRISLDAARRFRVLLAAGSLGFSLPLGLPASGFVAAMLVWTWVYNRFGKRWPFGGNLMVAVAASGVFPFLLLVSHTRDERLFWVTGFSLLFHLVRELVKDCADREGDREAGYRTVPLVRGPRFTLHLARSLHLLLILLVALASLRGTFGGPGYLGLTLGGYGLGGLVLLLRTTPAPLSCTRSARALKFLLVFAFLGLYLGR